MPRWQRWLSLYAFGLSASALLRPATPPEKLRARFERFNAVSPASLLRKYPTLTFADHAVGSLAMESLRAAPSPRCTILHLHGGAFVFGSPCSYRHRAMRLSYRCHAEVFVPEYRLAPEHPYAAALEDSLAAWRYVTARNDGVPLFLTGDSAGGGLVLSLLLSLRALGAPMPAGAILLSP